MTTVEPEHLRRIVNLKNTSGQEVVAQHTLDLDSKAILNLSQIDRHSWKVPDLQRTQLYSFKPGQEDLRALGTATCYLPMDFAEFQGIGLRK